MNGAEIRQVIGVELVHGLPASQYRARPGLGGTALKDLARSPAHYRERADRPPEPGAAMRVGTAAHALVLEPETTGRLVTATPAVDRRTTAGREAYAAWQAEISPEAIVLPTEDHTHACRMAEAVRRHPVAAELLANGAPEVSAFWTEEGVACKARADWLNGILVDLKTTRDASPRPMASAAAKLGYALQQAHYQSAFCKEMVFVCVESAPPYLVAVYVLSAYDVERAGELRRVLLERYRDCEESGVWPGYPAEIRELRLPGWAAHGGDDEY